MPQVNDVLLKIKEISACAMNSRCMVSIKELQDEMNITQADMFRCLQDLKSLRFITFRETPVAFIKLTMLGINADLNTEPQH